MSIALCADPKNRVDQGENWRGFALPAAALNGYIPDRSVAEANGELTDEERGGSVPPARVRAPHNPRRQIWWCPGKGWDSMPLGSP